MRYKINHSQIEKLTEIASRIVWQNPRHRENIISYYRVLINAAIAEFTDGTSLELFLGECHKEALSREFKGRNYEQQINQRRKWTEEDVKSYMKALKESNLKAKEPCPYEVGVKADHETELRGETSKL